jgi:hypothetical protein
MMGTSERLRVRAAVLETIDRRRRETGDVNLGSAIEHCILSHELRELEADILSTQEAPDPVPALVPRTLRPHLPIQK